MKFTRPIITTSFILAASAALSGCGAEDVATCDVKTTGFWVDFEAVASGDGSTRVRAELRVGGDKGSYGELCDNDSLVAYGDDDDDGEADDNVDMGHNEDGDVHYYLSRFDTDYDDGEFRIEFLRGDEDFEDALNNMVTLPNAFTMGIEGLDQEGDRIQRGNDVTVTWDNLDSGTINWEITGDCIWPESGEVDDNGELTISTEDIRVQSLNEGEDCVVEVILERTRRGTTDELFHEDSRFWGKQRRGFEFTSTPADSELGGDGVGGAGGAGN